MDLSHIHPIAVQSLGSQHPVSCSLSSSEKQIRNLKSFEGHPISPLTLPFTGKYLE